MKIIVADKISPHGVQLLMDSGWQVSQPAAAALATYGGYVTENSASPPGSGWQAWMYQMDHAAVASSGIETGAVQADLANLMPFLYVVVHNPPPL